MIFGGGPRRSKSAYFSFFKLPVNYSCYLSITYTSSSDQEDDSYLERDRPLPYTRPSSDPTSNENHLK